MSTPGHLYHTNELADEYTIDDVFRGFSLNADWQWDAVDIVLKKPFDDSDYDSVTSNDGDTLQCLLEPFVENVSWDDVAARLLTHSHEAAKEIVLFDEKYPSLLYPLHAALAKISPPPPARVIRALTDAYPPALTQKVLLDCRLIVTALTIACLNDMNDDEEYSDTENDSLVKVLLDASPEIASQVDGYGLIPLHRARTFAAASLLFEAFPEGISQKGPLGDLPIHSAARSCDVSDYVVQFLLDNAHDKPHSMASSTCSTGKIPLHVASSVMKARMLLAAFPEGIQVRDNQGCLAIHRAAERWNVCDIFAQDEKESDNLVQFLLDSYPLSATHIDNEGKIPLHYADNEETARILLETFPDGVRVKDDEGKLAIHYSLKKANSERHVKMLLEYGLEQFEFGDATAGGALVEDNGGTTPLKHVCEKITSAWCGFYESDERWVNFSSIVRAIYSASHRRHSMDVEMDEIPVLHAAIMAGCAASIVSIALGFEPEKIRSIDARGRTPLAVAAASRSSIVGPEIIKLLLDTSRHGWRGAASIADSVGRLPLHLAAESGRRYSDGLKDIAHAEPRAFETRDMKTQMHPFMLAAIGKNGDVGAVYSLLLEAPHLIQTVECHENNNEYEDIPNQECFSAVIFSCVSSLYSGEGWLLLLQYIFYVLFGRFCDEEKADLGKRK